MQKKGTKVDDHFIVCQSLYIPHSLSLSAASDVLSSSLSSDSDVTASLPSGFCSSTWYPLVVAWPEASENTQINKLKIISADRREGVAVSFKQDQY